MQQDNTELWEVLAETLEALAEQHPEITQTDLWQQLIEEQLITREG